MSGPLTLPWGQAGKWGHSEPCLPQTLLTSCMPRKTEVTCLPYHPLPGSTLSLGGDPGFSSSKSKFIPAVTVPRSHERQAFREVDFTGFTLTPDLSSLACFPCVHHVSRNPIVTGLRCFPLVLSSLMSFDYKWILLQRPGMVWIV